MEERDVIMDLDKVDFPHQIDKNLEIFEPEDFSKKLKIIQKIH